jgi:uncharacterized MAPEG superfamily protein
MPVTEAAAYPVEITLLIWSVALCVLQMLVAAVGANLQVGLPALAGNRQDMPPLTGWAGRAQRAHRNLLENLPLFAILVLVAAMAGVLNATTALGAQLFFWARVAYAAVYLAGIPYLRTLLWLGSMVGLALIFLQLV